jgi:hypothetical protein
MDFGFTVFTIICASGEEPNILNPHNQKRINKGRVDASQRSVHIELVSFEALGKPTR